MKSHRMLVAVLLVLPYLAVAEDPAAPHAVSRSAAVGRVEAARPARAIPAPASSGTGAFRRAAINPAVAANFRGAPLSAYRVLPRSGRNFQNTVRVSPSYDATNAARAGQPANAFRTIPRSGAAPLGARRGDELSYAQAQAAYSRQYHSRDWWRHRHVLVVLYGGGYWYWNAGWWFPAWGYDPSYSNYAYDGPIYGYGEMSPGDVTSQVQEALAQQGYYNGPIDGILGPETRDAILRFQADHGLAATAAIDEPTLDSLGLT